MASNLQKSFAPNGKEIRYLNRDFTQLREALINFSKTYFPNTYKDFSPASPGMMFMEQAAYVGDVVGYYTDYSFKEGMMLRASERKNIITHASGMGYKIKSCRAATGHIDIYQLCPSTYVNGKYVPDPKYMLLLKENSQFSNNENSFYNLVQDVDFTVNTAVSPRTDSVYSRNTDGTPQFFLLKKQGLISAGQIYTKEVVVGNPTPFFEIKLEEDNVLGIIDVIDSDNNKWYEVDYIAQEMVPTAVPNDAQYEGSLSEYRDSVPYILKYLKTSRRFTTFVDENNMTSLQFGAGVNGVDDELVTFDSNLINAGLAGISSVNISLDPSNFLKGESYGISPHNTTLTIRYLVGGGLKSNCQSNEVRNVVAPLFGNSTEAMTPEEVQLLNTVKNSLKASNPDPCVGGKDAETDEEIKLNAISHFSSQNRTVTQNDYLVRTYSLPSKYGSVAKAQVVANTGLGGGNGLVTNPFAINVYLLSYDANKKLIKPNKALVSNLITYLKQTRMLTDTINVFDGYVINIGIDFSVTVYKGFNKKDVLRSCIDSVKNFFNIDMWNFSQPINLSQLNLEIAKVDGVQSVVDVKISNKTNLDGDYSPVQYAIEAATKNGIIYPSVDPSIFEVKFPDSDIKASAL